MKSLWKGIALFAIWGGFASIIIVAVTKTHAELTGYAIEAVIVTMIIVFSYNMGLREKILALKKKEGKHDGHRNDDKAWCYDCSEMLKEGEWTNNKPYNQALADVTAILHI